MFGPEFFPTPEEMGLKMVEPYRKGIHSRTLLEPQAGKGDLVNALQTLRHFRSVPLNVDCIEIHPELQAVLRQKDGVKVIASDFLAWQPTRLYDLIVMNPPFSNGDEHLLHAWECLHGGDIACLLNETTLSNPHTKRRQLLKRIVDKHGSVEKLGPCFDSAERKTHTNVVLIRLHKKTEDTFSTLFEEAKFSGMTMTEDRDEPVDILLPAHRDLVGNMAIQFQESLRLFKEAMIAMRRLRTMMAPLSRYVYRSASRDADYLVESLMAEAFAPGCNAFATGLSKDAWDTVVDMAGLKQLMTQQVRNQFDHHITENKALDFTEDNIHHLIGILRDNTLAIMKEALCEVFDYLSRYHEENRVHIEGWKTNSAYMVGRRFILPMVVRNYYGDSFSLNKYREMDDIDRVLCNLEGKKIEAVLTINAALQAAFKGSDNTAESEFFTLRFFKKGTVHFRFKDDALWERFNCEAAKGKGWLPPGYRYKKGDMLKLAYGQPISKKSETLSIF